ncbi:MAG: hypothetical protein KGJ63_07340 [Pseudomonadota bacterium]|nr:hypothetical protein [Pseudomonadota bacterium]
MFLMQCGQLAAQDTFLNRHTPLFFLQCLHLRRAIGQIPLQQLHHACRLFVFGSQGAVLLSHRRQLNHDFRIMHQKLLACSSRCLIVASQAFHIYAQRLKLPLDLFCPLLHCQLLSL